MGSHFEMDGILRYRQLREYANRRNIHVRQIRRLRDRFNPLEEYNGDDFRLRFRFRKDSVIDLVKTQVAQAHYERSVYIKPVPKCKSLIRERTRMFDFFGMYLLLRYKAIGLLKNFGKRCQNSRFTANK